MVSVSKVRTPPPKKLDNYIASIQHLEGSPKSVPDSSFQESNFIVDGTDIGNIETKFANKVNLGFKITLNGVTYKDVSIGLAGWVILRDPAADATPEIWPAVISSVNPYSNSNIRSYFQGSKHVLLAPWFDENYTIAKDANALIETGGYDAITLNDVENIKIGKDTNLWPIDELDRGVRYSNFYDSKLGKYFLVRWTVSQNYYSYWLKFEVAIYENGRIEFRYWPIKKLHPFGYFLANSSATCGVFWSGLASNQFRDFSPLLDYKKSQRKINEFGGASYDASYTETGSPYSILITTDSWPKNGAIITFSPPTNSIKFLPRKLMPIIDANKEIIRSFSSYDDRRTINFYNGQSSIIHLPSNLPSRFMGDSGGRNISLQQQLFTSGSIRVTGNVIKDNVDGFISQLDVFDVKTKDVSFNEGQKDYLTTTSTKNFYATGSSLERFGEGFTSPLKSKTQFHLSLPVAKTVTMPSLTSSFYYYNSDRKSWDLMNPDGYSDPIPTIVYGSSKAGYDSDSFYYHRVFELSRGFDPVGRKIVSGSSYIKINNSNLFDASNSKNLQTDRVLGSLLNHSSGSGELSNLVSDSTTKEYSNSITDNQDFYPQKSQKISLPLEGPFLIEKVVVNLPFSAHGDWFSDRTTCRRPYGDARVADQVPSGAIDFGGPGLTFALMCPKRGMGDKSSYLDLIASGTITHHLDNTADVSFRKESNSNQYWTIRPFGFKAFSVPTAVVQGTFSEGKWRYEGKIKLEMAPSISGGLTIARNDRSLLFDNLEPRYVESNKNKAISLLSSPTISVKGEKYNDYDSVKEIAQYENRSPRVYIQQVSPISRGTSRVEFSGNSILGGNIASFNNEQDVENPLYYGTAREVENDFSFLNDPHFIFDSTMVYSTVDSQPSPYLMMPGDELTISISKSRPAIKKMYFKGSATQAGAYFYIYDMYDAGITHDTVQLATGSIDITIYGSYVKEGLEYNP
jgi:hypothetical protein